jgi:hypothetical protein
VRYEALNTTLSEHFFPINVSSTLHITLFEKQLPTLSHTSSQWVQSKTKPKLNPTLYYLLVLSRIHYLHKSQQWGFIGGPRGAETLRLVKGA